MNTIEAAYIATAKPNTVNNPYNEISKSIETYFQKNAALANKPTKFAKILATVNIAQATFFQPTSSADHTQNKMNIFCGVDNGFIFIYCNEMLQEIPIESTKIFQILSNRMLNFKADSDRN